MNTGRSPSEALVGSVRLCGFSRRRGEIETTLQYNFERIICALVNTSLFAVTLIGRALYLRNLNRSRDPVLLEWQ